MATAREDPEALARAAGAALREMFEPDVAVAVWGADVTSLDVRPEEAELVRRAVASRRVEFARGRSCARAALVAAGGDPVTIPVGPRREPVFPDGFTGTITHCDGLVAAVVAPERTAAGIGVDAERVQPLGDDVLGAVLTERERTGLEAFGAEGSEQGDAAERADSAEERSTAIFSAKEAVFKAVFPRTGVWLDFQDVALEVSDSTFAVDWATESVDQAALALLERLEGRWRRVEGLLLTACWLEPAG